MEKEVMSDPKKKAATEELQSIVDQFNKDFNSWMERTGCRVQFGWKYSSKEVIKALEIQGIDVIVYRKPPPDFVGINMKDLKKE